MRLCVVVTVDITLLNLCRGRFEYLNSRGFEVTAVCAPTPHEAQIRATGARLFTAPLTRSVTPFTDLRALWTLFRFFRRERFDLIEVSTPKAALIGSLAAWLAGAPHVVHLLRGLAYERQGRFRTWWLRMAHRVPCRLAHRVIAISRAVAEEAAADRMCSADKIVVLGAGSSNGIDLERFHPPDAAKRRKAREQFGFSDDTMVVGFVGRMTVDKGIVELVDAFVAVAEANPLLHLLLVGDYESGDPPPERIIRTIAGHPRIRHAGWRSDVREGLWAMDLFVLPTHREGFGTVLLEAAATALPVITTDAVGWWDTVRKDEEAICVPIGDTGQLAAAMARLAADAKRRDELAAAGRSKVVANYDCHFVWRLQEQEFRRILGR